MGWWGTRRTEEVTGPSRARIYGYEMKLSSPGDGRPYRAPPDASPLRRRPSGACQGPCDWDRVSVLWSRAGSPEVDPRDAVAIVRNPLFRIEGVVQLPPEATAAKNGDSSIA